MSDHYLESLADLHRVTRDSLVAVRRLMEIEKKKTTERGKRLRRIERHLENAAAVCRL